MVLGMTYSAQPKLLRDFRATVRDCSAPDRRSSLLDQEV